jgi:hypothetical protein
MDEWMDGWMDRYGWMDGWMDIDGWYIDEDVFAYTRAFIVRPQNRSIRRPARDPNPIRVYACVRACVRARACLRACVRACVRAFTC